MTHSFADVDAELAALKRLEDLWRREHAAAQAQVITERRETPLKLRVKAGTALRGLSVDDVGALPGRRCRVKVQADPAEQLAHFQGNAGAPVKLWWSDPEAENAINALVHRKRGDRLELALDERHLDALESGGFRLDLDAPSTTFNRGMEALRLWAKAAPDTNIGRLRHVIFGTGEGELLSAPVEGIDPTLNAPQQAAVRGALQRRPLHLIHGPPGTGKTRTLLAILAILARREKVLVCAPSNSAVDHLVEGLLAAGLDPIRLGHPSRVSPGAERCTLDSRVEEAEASALARQWQAEGARLQRQARAKWARGQRGESQALRAQARQLFRDARQYLQRTESAILSQARVVCTTLAGAGGRRLDACTFDTVIVDEATQAPDPLMLVALSRGATAILAGDPQQLPPTIIDVTAAREGLARTIFERLTAERPVLCQMLEVQYRMHAAIMQFPSDQMYDGRLEAHESVAAHTLDDLDVRPDMLRPGPLVFIDTAGKGFDEQQGVDDPTISNPGQGDRTAAEVRRLLGRGLPPEHVAVIAPYRGQVMWLRSALAEARAQGLEIDSVDGFQGREKEAVVVDLVRSNPDGAMGFLGDVRRMNVALTRARRCLYVIGDSATLGQHPFYEAFMAAVEDHGAWISAWSDDAPPFEG
ncbi:MAG: AAA domain-containing protein [Bradymonadia bacterium]